MSMPGRNLVAAGWKLLLAGGAAAALAAGSGGVALAWNTQPQTPALSGNLYFTRFATANYPCANFCGTSPDNVGQVSFNYTGGTLTLGTPDNITQVPAADGIAMTPAKDLLVGGQFTGDVFDVNPTTGAYTTVGAGTPTAYMLGLSADGRTAYVGSVGDNSAGELGVVSLYPTVTTVGTIHVVGPDQNIDGIAFAGGVAYFTSSLPDGLGDFGSINLGTGQETVLISGLPAAHGMVYDSYTGDLILSGENEIAQINPATSPPTIVGTQTVDLQATDGSVAGGQPGLNGGYFDVYDLPWTTGDGQVFVSANDGQTTFIDYAKTANIETATYVTTLPVESWLDDMVGAVTSSSCQGSNCGVSCGSVSQNSNSNNGYNYLGYQSNDQNQGQNSQCCSNQGQNDQCCSSQGQNGQCCGQQSGNQGDGHPVSDQGSFNWCKNFLSTTFKSCVSFCHGWF